MCIELPTQYPVRPVLVPVSLAVIPGKHAGKLQHMLGGPLSCTRLPGTSIWQKLLQPPAWAWRKEQFPKCQRGSSCPPLPAQAHLVPGHSH